MLSNMNWNIQQSCRKDIELAKWLNNMGNVYVYKLKINKIAMLTHFSCKMC